MAEDLRKPGAPDPPPPEQRFGKYSLLRELGRGGMAVVWEALDRELGRRVALKLLRGVRQGGPDSGGVREEEALERFTREARTSAKLQHPGIVKVFEVGVHEGLCFIAMEFIEGVTLGEALDRNLLGTRALLMALRDAARAVHYAHENGVLHRDIKPQNVMITPEGQTFVMDFGLARDLRAETRVTVSGIAIGTPSYMSPEHAQGSKDQADARGDVYSLGAVLYEILSGRPPFSGESPVQVMLAVVQQDPLSPRMIRTDVSPELEVICLKAIDKDPARRYATAAEFADDLDRYLQGEAVQARPASLAYRARKKIRKHLAVAALASLAAILLAGWALYAVSRARAERRKVVRQLERAMELEAAGEFARAEELYEAVLVLDPGEAAARAGRARCEEARRPPSVPDRREEVEIFLGVPDGGRGIRLLEHPKSVWEAAAREGKPCARVRPNRMNWGNLYFDVDEEWARGTSMAELEVEYLDPAPGGRGFMFHFDSTGEDGACRYAGGVAGGAGSGWKTARILLPNPRFGNRLEGAADLRLDLDLRDPSKGADLHVHRLRLRRVPGDGAVPRARAVPLSPASLRPGLAAEYYSGRSFGKLLGRGVDERVDFNWGTGPGPAGLEDNYSIRWTGYVLVPESGRYAFETRSDDGVRLRVGGQSLVSNWKYHALTVDAAACDLEAGYHSLVLEYFEGVREAEVRLLLYVERDSKMVPVDPPSFFHVPSGK